MILFENLGSKCATKAMYEDTNRQVEKISGTLYTVLVKVLPQCMIWPTFVVGVVKYHAMDADEDGEALELPIPLWFVCFPPDISPISSKINF